MTATAINVTAAPQARGRPAPARMIRKPRRIARPNCAVNANKLIAAARRQSSSGAQPTWNRTIGSREKPAARRLLSIMSRRSAPWTAGTVEPVRSPITPATPENPARPMATCAMVTRSSDSCSISPRGCVYGDHGRLRKLLSRTRLRMPTMSATNVDGAQTQRNSLMSMADGSPLKNDAIPIGEVARGRQGKK